MMKKLLIVLGFIAVYGVNANAQMVFSPDSAYAQLIPGTLVTCKIKLTNSYLHDVQLSWRMINSTIKDFGHPGGSWLVQYCDCNNCASNEFIPLNQGDTCGGMLASGANADWYMTVDPGTVEIANAEWIVEVYNHTDDVYDTISYFLLGPNSIKETTYNASVTSFPNPAKNQLNIEYSLTNVNAPVLSVYNLIGAKVASHALNGSNGRFELNTSNLENGMYFYTIEEQGQRVFIKKFNVVH